MFNCIVYDVEHEYTVLISDWFGEKTYHTKDRARAEEAAEMAVYNGRACYSCVTDESGDMICEFES